jgi:hypothetical protein
MATLTITSLNGREKTILHKLTELYTFYDIEPLLVFKVNDCFRVYRTEDHDWSSNLAGIVSPVPIYQY